MNQRVFNLAKWRFMRDGSAMTFSNTKRRTVILDVNAPDEVRFYVVQDPEAVRNNPERLSDQEAGRESSGDDADDKQDLTFVGLVKGRDRLEFAVDGAFDLVVEGGGAYVYSADGQDIATRIVAPLIFTRIANRRARNPHLELIQYQMRLNMERMQDQLAEELERREKAFAERLETYAAQRNPGTVVEDLGGQAKRRGSVAMGEPGRDDEQDSATEDESGEGVEVPRKRKKSAASEDL